MVRQAVSSGEGEDAMWKSVARVDCLLEKLKEEKPQEYWDFIRKAHEDMYGEHFDKQFAEYEVSQMYSTDKDGRGISGAHWTLQEIKTATQGKNFPKGTTEWDLFVAYNACAHDFCKKFSDSEVLDIAYLFFFDDEDAPEGKIWRYMNAMRLT